MHLVTVREQDAYDRGFESGKDWWVPLEQDRILNLLRDRLETAKKVDDVTVLTAMQVPVDKECAIAVTEALIWAVKDAIEKEDKK